MFEFIIVAALLFSGGLMFGLVSGRHWWLALLLAGLLAIVTGVYLGEWSAYRTMLSRWDAFLHACISILFYFAVVTGPAAAGAVAGILIRGARNARHRKDPA